MGCLKVLPPHQAIMLERSSWFIMGSVVSAIRYTHYDFAVLSLISFITSFLYWRNPVQKSWRQRLDRITVRSSFLFLSLRVQHQWHTMILYDKQVYMIMILLGISCYLLSGMMSRFTTFSHYSVYAHLLFHILANISNMFIFSKLPPLDDSL